MSESMFTKEVATGFAMLKMKKPENGFREIHLTVSVDEDKKSTNDEVWRLPHFTLIEMNFMGSVERTHIYIRSKMDGFDLVNIKGTTVYDPRGKYLPTCEKLMTYSEVTWAINNPERFVLYGA